MSLKETKAKKNSRGQKIEYILSRLLEQKPDTAASLKAEFMFFSQVFKKYPEWNFWRFIELGFVMKSVSWLKTERADRMISDMWKLHLGRKKFKVEESESPVYEDFLPKKSGVRLKQSQVDKIREFEKLNNNA